MQTVLLPLEVILSPATWIQPVLSLPPPNVFHHRGRLFFCGMINVKGGEQMEKLTLSVPKAAKVIGVSAPTMYQLARSEGFPSIIVGKRILASKKGLERWVEEQAQKGWYSR